MFFYSNMCRKMYFCAWRFCSWVLKISNFWFGSVNCWVRFWAGERNFDGIECFEIVFFSFFSLLVLFSSSTHIFSGHLGSDLITLTDEWQSTEWFKFRTPNCKMEGLCQQTQLRFFVFFFLVSPLPTGETRKWNYRERKRRWPHFWSPSKELVWFLVF